MKLLNTAWPFPEISYVEIYFTLVGCDHSDLPPEKGSPISQLLSVPDHVALEHLQPDHFQKAMRHIRKCQSELGRAQLHRHDAPRLLAELHLTADLMLVACRYVYITLLSSFALCSQGSLHQLTWCSPSHACATSWKVLDRTYSGLSLLRCLIIQNAAYYDARSISQIR